MVNTGDEHNIELAIAYLAYWGYLAGNLKRIIVKIKYVISSV